MVWSCPTHFEEKLGVFQADIYFRRKCKRRKKEPIKCLEEEPRRTVKARKESYVDLPTYNRICYGFDLREKWPRHPDFDPLLSMCGQSGLRLLATKMIGLQNVLRIEDHRSFGMLKRSLEELQRNRVRLNLVSVLDMAMPVEKPFEMDLSSCLDNTVTFAQLNKFLWSLGHLLIPKSLLGAKNVDQFLKNSCEAIFFMKRFGSIAWQIFYHDLKISYCPWLKSVSDSAFQFGCFKKTLVWLLNFFVALIR